MEPAHMPDNKDEFFRAVPSACGRRDFFLVDEIAKSQVKPAELEAALLGLKRGAQVRILYRGWGSMGTMPVLVLADTVLPDVLRDSTQLARRVIHIHLGAGGVGTDWRTTCSGGEIEGWRDRRDRNRAVANELVSEVRDAIDGLCTFHDA